MISRRQALALAAGAAAAPHLAAFRALARPLAYDLQPVPIGEGAWMVAGAQEAITFANGGAIANVAILDSEAGAIVIDAGPSRWYGEALRTLAERLTGKPVARVYLTHFHPDHVFGAQAFDPRLVAAPLGVIQGLKEHGDGFADAMYQIALDWMRGTEVVLPQKILGEGVEDFGGRRIRPLTLSGHTASDLALFDERTGILFAGDLAFLDRAPTTPHANLAAWRTSLAKLASILSVLLVPGHGPAEPGGRALAQTRDWLDAIEFIIRDAFERGLDPTEAMALPLPAWTRDIALARYEFVRSVQHFYPKLEASRWERVDETP